MSLSQHLEPQTGDALLVVDLQNDFLPGGALGISGGDEVIAPLNRMIDDFEHLQLPIFFSRDWHPANHCSFQAQGGPWPEHCVQQREGAAFSREIRQPEKVVIISKATDPVADAYSAFEGTDLHAQLQSAGVKRLWLGGLATDYCVLHTVEDAVELGYLVMLMTDTICAVDVEPGDGERAIARMLSMGVQPITTDEVLHEYS